MKRSTLSALIAAALLSPVQLAQAQSTFLTSITSCSQYCYGYSWGLNSASTTCQLSDYACNCKNQKIIDDLSTCDQGRCTQAQLDADFPAIVKACSDYGVAINLPSAKANPTASATALPTYSIPTYSIPTYSSYSTPYYYQRQGLTVGAIVGIVIAALFVLAVIGSIILLLVMRRKKKARQNAAMAGTAPGMTGPQGPGYNGAPGAGPMPDKSGANASYYGGGMEQGYGQPGQQYPMPQQQQQGYGAQPGVGGAMPYHSTGGSYEPSRDMTTSPAVGTMASHPTGSSGAGVVSHPSGGTEMPADERHGGVVPAAGAAPHHTGASAEMPATTTTGAPTKPAERFELN